MIPTTETGMWKCEFNETEAAENCLKVGNRSGLSNAVLKSCLAAAAF